MIDDIKNICSETKEFIDEYIYTKDKGFLIKIITGFASVTIFLIVIFIYSIIAFFVMFFVIGLPITLVYMFVIYFIPAVIVAVFSLYIIYSAALLVLSIPFAAVITFVGLSQSERSTNFHRTRNLFFSIMLLLIASETFNVNVYGISFLKSLDDGSRGTLEHYMPGIMGIISLGVYFHLMRQIYDDGSKAISESSDWRFWNWSVWEKLRWPPTTFIGIISDFFFPTIILMGYLGNHGELTRKTTIIFLEHIDKGFSNFLSSSFDVKISILDQIIAYWDNSENYLDFFVSFIWKIYNTSKDIIYWWYSDFI